MAICFLAVPRPLVGILTNSKLPAPSPSWSFGSSLLNASLQLPLALHGQRKRQSAADICRAAASMRAFKPRLDSMQRRFNVWHAVCLCFFVLFFFGCVYGLCFCFFVRFFC